MNFSYANRVLKAELQRFLDLICKDAKRPVAKLFFDLVCGVMRSGSTLVSMVARSLSPDGRIKTAECRLTEAMSAADPSPIESSLADFAIGMSAGFLALDESDVQKPYGRAFQWLDDVMDGSDPDKRIGKGYHVIGMASVSQRNQPIPFLLHAYSAKADGFESQLREHRKAFAKNAPGLCLSMDRGYDGEEWPRFARARSLDWVIRARSTRKYSTPSSKSSPKDIRGIAAMVKGRYAFYFPEPGKGDPVEVKATAVRIAHRGFAKGTWLAIEFFPDEREARCYLTNVDCSTREGCRKALSCYRSRWRVEETFRFMKVFYSMEGFMVRNVNAMNWLLLAVCAATAFLSSIAALRTPAYWQCKNAFRSFAPDMTDEEIVAAKGHIPVELYRLASGAKEILGHSTSKMTPKGRDRSRRKPIQLMLDIDFGD